MVRKRMFDIVFSILGIILVLPLLIIVSILIKLTSDGPIIFKQKRIGQYGKKFDIYKFRTMIKNSESKGAKITIGKDPRITNIGFILRKYKIDELPQLFNILKGEMSFVGPRPEVEKYVEIYKKEYENILKIKPGITDLASIKYSNENDILANKENPENYYINNIMKEKINLNNKYLEKIGIKNDVKIIFKTIVKCVKN